MANPRPGFNVKKYDRATKKAGNNYKRSTREVVAPGINTVQRGSDKLNVVRVPKPVKNKPMSMTFGGSKNGKGITKTFKRY